MSNRQEHHFDDGVLLLHGEALEVLKTIESNSIDAIVTDPPYGLSNTKPAQVADVLKEWVTGDDTVVPEGKGFMGKDWDGFVPPPAVWKECMRVLKPGGHMAVFAGARTQDLMGLSIRLAGFEIRDTLGWIYGSGFPKSMDVSKAIDKGQGVSESRAYEFTEWMRSTGITAREINEATGTKMGHHYTTHPTQPSIATADLFDKMRPLLPEVPERIERLVAERTGIEWTDYVKREVVGRSSSGIGTAFGDGEWAQGKAEEFDVTTSHSDEAKQWSGWGTALKPAIEPIILARKPIEGTVANNVISHGVGGLNIDACRVTTEEDTRRNAAGGDNGLNGESTFKIRERRVEDQVRKSGRFPANVLLDEHAAQEMDEQSGVSVSSDRPRRNTAEDYNRNVYQWGGGSNDWTTGGHSDSGGASRFFPVFKYQAKAPKKERPVVEREDGSKIQHPTVKPVALMEWLVNLITPEGGTVLDPFTGSGTTLEAAKNQGFNSIGIEMGEEYVHLVEERFRKRRERLEDDE